MLPNLQPSFVSIRHMVWDMSFKEFQDDRHGSHLEYWNKTVLTILSCQFMMPSMMSQCLLRSFGSIRHMVREILFADFKTVAMAVNLDIGTERF